MVPYTSGLRFVAHVAGGEGIYGTNPVCFAFPHAAGGAEAETFVIDIATAAIAFYGILDRKGKGLPLPAGAAFDTDGNPTTDPDEALKGTLVPFGGHKGAGFALAVELIGATLANAGVAGDKARPKGSNWGHTVVAFKPTLLIPDFPERASTVLRNVKNSAASVRLPGEASAANARSNEKKGSITLPAGLWKGITDLASTAPSPASRL